MLRDYQVDLLTAIDNAGDANVLAVGPCGCGKTVMMSQRAAGCDGPNAAIAHRQELVGQISGAFAKAGLKHRIIAPSDIINDIVADQMKRFGARFYDPKAHIAVASVDTLIRRDDPFFETCVQWQVDEAHHLLMDNKWGRALAMMPHAKGIGWTATPCRADRRSLKRGAGGVFDVMVQGPTMRELIDRGYLADYRIWGLPKVINTAGLRITGSGEFNEADVSAEAHAHVSQIVGDIVTHYQRLASGLSGVTFAVDVDMAEKHAQAFRDAGITAAVLHAKTPGAERRAILAAFLGKQLMQIVNVGILGEGFDCAGIQVISMARPTASLPFYVQMVCRPLRPDGLKVGLILDHVGNVAMHGLPDSHRVWSLDVPERRRGTPRLEIPITICGNPDCLQPYEGFEPVCPYCGWEKKPTERNRPEAVDGDLTLYTPELIAELRREAARIAGAVQTPDGLSPLAAAGAAKTWRARQEAQTGLREAIDRWAGYYINGLGESRRAAYRRFFATFGMDTVTALTQSGPAMAAMTEAVNGSRS